MDPAGSQARLIERMDGGLTLLNIILLAVAIGVFLKLRSVLGRRTGHERPPYDPYSDTGNPAGGNPSGNDKVVTLPTRPRPQTDSAARGRTVDAAGDPFAEPAEIRNRWRGIADDGTPVAETLSAIARVDRSFDAEAFLGGARAAYEMIVTAYADGDRAALQPLLSAEVFGGFEAAIADREKKELHIEQSFIGIDKAKLSTATLDGSRARLTVTFRSQLTSSTRTADGVVVEGDPVTIREVNDVWTFERDISSRDPNWKLVATGASA